MSIKLKHSGGNSVSLNPPTSAPTSSEVAFKLPNADGSANQVIKTDGSGNLAFTTPAAGLWSSYAMIADVKSEGSDAGQFTQDQWQVRDLNTIVFDPDNIVTLNNNIFNLTAGTYFIKAHAPAMRVNKHKAVLFRESGTQTILIHGTSEYSTTDHNYQTRSFITGRVTVTATTNLQIRHRCTTTRANNGLGHNITAGDEYYTIVEIYKES